MRIAVYCGAHLGADPAYLAAAKELGQWFVENNHELIYGGSRLGLMGVVADSVLAGNRKVIGIMPKFLQDTERIHTGLTEMITVNDLDERKKALMQHSDVCLALPGGVGTLEEISEAFSWARVGQNIHCQRLIHSFTTIMQNKSTLPMQRGFIFLDCHFRI